MAAQDERDDVENLLRARAGLPPAEPRPDPDELLAAELAAAEMALEDEGIQDDWEDVDSQDEGVGVD